MAILRFTSTWSRNHLINSAEHFVNLMWSSHHVCTKSYCISTQTTNSFSIIISIGFPGDSRLFYHFKSKINIIQSISKHGINIYGFNFCEKAFEYIALLLSYCYCFLVEMKKFFGDITFTRFGVKLTFSDAN